MAVPPSDERTAGADRQKPRRAEGWLIVVGVLILLGLLGHLINQQQASSRTPGIDAGERPPLESPPTTAPEAPPSDATRRNDVGNVTPAPQRVAYMVTHKHRLRDCHGTLTFTRKELRFDSDEAEDSFVVGLDEVSLQDDGLRVRNKLWRFEFNDGLRVEELLKDWKPGALPPRRAP